MNVFESEQDLKKENKEGEEAVHNRFWKSWAIGASILTIVMFAAYKSRVKILKFCKSQMGPMPNGFEEIDQVARAATRDKRKKKIIKTDDETKDDNDDSIKDEHEKIRMHHKANQVEFKRLKRRSEEITAMEDDIRA